MTKLQEIVSNAELFHQMSAFDWEILVCDSDGKVVCFLPANSFRPNIKIGDIPQGGAIQECLKTHKPVSKIIPEHVYGFKLRANVRPIFESGGVFAGLIATGTTLKLQDELGKAAQSIAATSQQISATVEELAGTASRLADNMSSVRKDSEQVFSEIKKTDDILRFVSQIAGNSNLLGLNAAIEAARAGEAGKGFAVVAEEIRKMAVSSSQSVKDIKAILQTIQNNTRSVANTLSATADLGEKQAAATEEISAAMQQLTSVAREVETMAHIV